MHSSSIVALGVPRAKKLGRIQSIGSQRVRQDRRELACMHILYTFSIVDEAEVFFFVLFCFVLFLMEFLCFLHDPMNVGN